MKRWRNAAGAGILLMAMIGVPLVAAVFLLDARDVAERAGDDLKACMAASARIRQLERLPRGQSAGPIDAAFVHQRGQQALQTLGLPAEHLVQIVPGTPQRVGETGYKEVPTSLVLRDLNLRQIVQLLLSVTDGSRLSVKSLRLSAPRDTEDGAQWSAEATLSYLIFEGNAGNGVTAVRERN